MLLLTTELIWSYTIYTGLQKREGLRFFNFENSKYLTLKQMKFLERYSSKVPELFWNYKIYEFSWPHTNHPDHFTVKSILTRFLLVRSPCPCTQIPPGPYQGNGMFSAVAICALGSTQENSSQACSVPRVNMHFYVALNQHDGKEGLGRLLRDFR